MTKLRKEPQPINRRIFISHTSDDLDFARRIGAMLEEAGIRVEREVPLSSQGQNLLAEASEAVRAGDVVVLLLTSTALGGPQAGSEIELASRDMSRRGVDLIPVLAAPVSLPPALDDRGVVDLTNQMDTGMRRLAEQIQAASRVDFSSMSPMTFEEMVGDLLTTAGFNVDASRPAGDAHIDFRATYQRTDPFGSPEIETWLVETKFYSSARVSVETIRGLAGMVATTPGNVRGLLVTNGQLTSMARDVLVDLGRHPSLRLQVLDGVDLKRLLRQFPAVAERHFAAETADQRQKPDADS